MEGEQRTRVDVTVTTRRRSWFGRPWSKALTALVVILCIALAAAGLGTPLVFVVAVGVVAGVLGVRRWRCD